MFVFIVKKHIPELKHIISIFLTLKNIPFSVAFPCISSFSLYSNIVHGYLLNIADFVSSGNSSNFSNFAPECEKLEKRYSLVLGEK